MYTRSFPDRGTEIPEGYVGSAVKTGEGPSDGHYIEGARNPWESTPQENAEEVAASKDVSTFSGLFGGLFQNGKLSLQSIGFEEILIIAAAAYMLMSRDGDRECGIMLLVLLFIS